VFKNANCSDFVSDWRIVGTNRVFNEEGVISRAQGLLQEGRESQTDML
jgi:hypothetical protein